MKVSELINSLNNLTSEQKDMEITWMNGDYGIYIKVGFVRQKNGYCDYVLNGNKIKEYYNERMFDAPLVQPNPDINPVNIIVLYSIGSERWIDNEMV